MGTPIHGDQTNKPTCMYVLFSSVLTTVRHRRREAAGLWELRPKGSGLRVGSALDLSS